MSNQEITPFSLPDIIAKVKQMFLVPVTNIVFDEENEYGKYYMDEDLNHRIFTATIYANDDMVGTIPYMSSSFGPMFHDNSGAGLLWDEIYKLNHQDIFKKIGEQEPLADSVETGDAHVLFVKDKNGTIIKRAYYNYIDDEWRVMVSGMDAQEKVKVVTVTLFPPPPRM